MATTWELVIFNHRNKWLCHGKLLAPIHCSEGMVTINKNWVSNVASSAPSLCKASHVPGLALIEDELEDPLSGDLDQLLVSPPHHLQVCGVLPAPQPTNADALDLSTISLQLTSLAKAISNLSLLPPLPLPADVPTCGPTLGTPAKPPWLISTLPHNTIIKLIHCEGTHLPSVCPCNTFNALDAKTHWTLEDLH